MATRRTAPRARASALTALTLTEKGELLDQLLTIQSELRKQAEELARLRLVVEDRDTIASDVESALNCHDILELNSHAGYQPGRGYIHPGEAAARSSMVTFSRSLTTLRAAPSSASRLPQPRSPPVFFTDSTHAARPTRKRCSNTPPTTPSSAPAI